MGSKQSTKPALKSIDIVLLGDYTREKFIENVAQTFDTEEFYQPLPPLQDALKHKTKFPLGITNLILQYSGRTLGNFDIKTIDSFPISAIGTNSERTFMRLHIFGEQEPAIEKIRAYVVNQLSPRGIPYEDCHGRKVPLDKIIFYALDLDSFDSHRDRLISISNIQGETHRVHIIILLYNHNDRRVDKLRKINTVVVPERFVARKKIQRHVSSWLADSSRNDFQDSETLEEPVSNIVLKGDPTINLREETKRPIIQGSSENWAVPEISSEYQKAINSRKEMYAWREYEREEEKVLVNSEYMDHEKDAMKDKKLGEAIADTKETSDSINHCDIDLPKITDWDKAKQHRGKEYDRSKKIRVKMKKSAPQSDYILVNQKRRLRRYREIKEDSLMKCIGRVFWQLDRNICTQYLFVIKIPK